MEVEHVTGGQISAVEILNEAERRRKPVRAEIPARTAKAFSDQPMHRE